MQRMEPLGVDYFDKSDEVSFYRILDVETWYPGANIDPETMILRNKIRRHSG